MIFNKIFFKLIWMCNRHWLGSESGIGNRGSWFCGDENNLSNNAYNPCGIEKPALSLPRINKHKNTKP